jgi:hypothetical protein
MPRPFSIATAGTGVAALILIACPGGFERLQQPILSCQEAQSPHTT